MSSSSLVRSSRSTTCAGQPIEEAAALVAEAGLDAILAPEDDRLAVIVPAEEILGEVEPRVWEEARAGHPIRVGEACRTLVADRDRDVV